MANFAGSCLAAGYEKAWAPLQYLADGERVNWGEWREHGLGKGRPSIHMPRWASRLTLTVTDVRVQQLQEISEGDARAEGMTFLGTPPDTWGIECLVSSAAARRSFWLLWDFLHGPGAWNANPHVVALTFSVARRNIDAP